jgi:soluble cytochrome b562
LKQARNNPKETQTTTRENDTQELQKKTENNLPILKLTSEREMTKFKNGCKEFNKNL